MADFLTSGAVLGTTIVACTIVLSVEASLAAMESACPKFPEECVKTLTDFGMDSREERYLRVAFSAPRNLKEPVTWKASILKKRFRPALLSISGDVKSGVTLATSLILEAPVFTSSKQMQ